MFRAEHKQRRKAQGEDGLTAVELGETPEELDEQPTLLFADLQEPIDKHFIGKVVEDNHHLFVPDVLATSPRTSPGPRSDESKAGIAANHGQR
jgi:hypothetical protein